MKLLVFVLLIGCAGHLVQADPFDPELGDGYFPCGHFQCVNETGVSCDGDRCRCPKDEVGDARILCAHPDEHCLCAIHDDPHFIDYNGVPFHLPLPCQHVITDFTTPETPENPEGCQVVIVGMAFFRDKKQPLATFENVIDILLVTEQSRYTAKLRANYTPETTFVQFKRGEPDVFVNETEENNFFIIEIEPCGILIKYNAYDGWFTILTPIDTIDSAGLCGSCNGSLTGSRHHKKLKGFPLVMRTVDALYGSSPIDGFETNTIEECIDLTATVDECPEDRNEFAKWFCTPILTASPIIHALGNVTNLITAFDDCFGLVCGGPHPCTKYKAVYLPFPTFPLPDYITDLFDDPTFCFH